MKATRPPPINKYLHTDAIVNSLTPSNLPQSPRNSPIRNYKHPIDSNLTQRVSPRNKYAFQVVISKQPSSSLHLNVYNDNMRQCEDLSYTIRNYAFLDGIFTLAFALDNIYLVIPISISLVGYYGAKTYNKYMNLIFLYYLSLSGVSRITYYVLANYVFIKNDLMHEWLFVYFTVITFMIFFIDLWGFRMTYKFKDNLNKLNHKELELLRDNLYKNGKCIMW